MPESSRSARRLAALRGLAVTLLLAVLAGQAVLAQAPEAPSSGRVEPSDGLSHRIEFRNRLAEMLEAVEQHHVDDGLESTRLVHGAIRGMLDTLDPHTHFLDTEAYRTMREGQDGSFYGLGIIISVRRDRTGQPRLTVISPMDGMPAKRLGVRPGDIIAAIDGDSTDGLTLDGAVVRLRGEKGSSVIVTIERDGERFDLAIERAEIPTESIQHAYMIEPGTGFIRIKDFTKTTTRELREEIAALREQGMERLLLDLRENPGGLLDQAVSVSSVFLEPDQTVVETRGRQPGSNDRHVALDEGARLPRDVPVIVLINRGSASASEIVAGAVQDHDRGLVVGSTSWGKGLVQSVYSLSADCGLALTTARYYTPSGRLIQRDYRSSYFDYYYPRKDASPNGDIHETAGGRTVFGGIGIQPDVVVEDRPLEPDVARLVSRSVFYRYATQVHLKEKAGQVKAGYRLTAEDVAGLRAFAAGEEETLSEEEWAKADDQVRSQLLQEIVSAHLGIEEAFKVAAENDPQVQAALKLWDHAGRSAILRDARAGRVPVVGPAGILADEAQAALVDREATSQQ